MNAHLERVAGGWDAAVDGYEAYFVPRFAPWVSGAVGAVASGALPPGPILVPCCGTFPELDLLVEHFPDREIVGIDLSAGMVGRARRRVAGRPGVTVVEGDASTLDAGWTGGCGAVVSVFGLQQLPRPERAVRSWLAALGPGGMLSVVYWPDATESDGPFALMDAVVRRHVPPGDSAWEDELVPALHAQGAVIERDDHPSHPLSHPGAPAFFDAYTRSGPLRALAIARGDAFIAGLRREFLRDAPEGRWTHRPLARHIVARRTASKARGEASDSP
ncbi:class I SAM-dependent methyltransferase [Planomonospora algeriensis]